MSEDTNIPVNNTEQDRHLNLEETLLQEQHFRHKKVFNDSEWLKQKVELQRKTVKSKFLFPKRGELWTCMFGLNIGSEINDIRPCVIVQNDIGNQKSPTVIVVPISHRECKLPTHVKLSIDLIEYTIEGVEGCILCEQIKTYDKARLGRRIGRLNDKGIKEVDRALEISLYGFILKEA